MKKAKQQSFVIIQIDCVKNKSFYSINFGFLIWHYETIKTYFFLDDRVDDLNYFRDIAADLGHKTEIFMKGNEFYLP